MAKTKKVKLPDGYFWKMAQHDYQNPWMAILREFAQNSIDAGAKNILFRIHKEEPKKWKNAYFLYVEDDGSGMTKDILENKLLVLWESGKDGAPWAVGGFGKAKEILFFSHKQWSITTNGIDVYGKYDRFELYDSFTPSSAEFVGAGVVSGAQKKGTTIELLIEEEVFESIVSSLDVLLLFESNVDIRFVESIGTLKQSSTWEHTVFHRPSWKTPFRSKKKLKTFPFGTLYEVASVTTEGLDHSNFGDYRRDYGQLLVYCDGCFMYGDHISSTNKYQLKLKNYKSLTISRDSMKEKIDKEVKNFISGHETKERLSVMDRANSCIIIKGDELTFVQGRNGFDRKSLDFNGRKFNIRKDISVLHEVFDGIFFLNVSEFATKFDKLLAIISKHGLEDTPLVFDRSFHLFEMAVNLMDEPDFDWEAVKQNLRHYRNACDKVMRTFLVKVHRSQMADAQGDGLVLSDSIESKTFGNHPMFGSKLTNAWDSFMSEFSNKEELFCALLSWAEYALSFCKEQDGQHILTGDWRCILAMNPFRYTQPNDTDSTKSISILLLAIHELTHFFISEHDSRFAYIHDEILKSCIEEFYSNPVKTVSCVENAIGGVFPEHEKEPLIRSIEKIWASLHRTINDNPAELRNFVRYSSIKYRLISSRYGHTIWRLWFCGIIHFNSFRLLEREKELLLKAIGQPLICYDDIIEVEERLRRVLIGRDWYDRYIVSRNLETIRRGNATIKTESSLDEVPVPGITK